MSFFLKKTTPSKKGLYLQIYQSFHLPGTGSRNKSYQALGYVEDMKRDGISDPIAYANGLVEKLNSEADFRKKDIQIGDDSACFNLGYFIIKILMDKLNVDYTINKVAANRRFRFELSEFIRSMMYAQIVDPGSKHKAFEKVLPSLLGASRFSYDQILDTVNYLGQDYKKFIEIFNHQVKSLYGVKTDSVLFDCTNYYFEIDLPHEDKQNGPSKEERHLPIIGQGLMLDSNQIPIGMTLYPGNESEKPVLRQVIEDMKEEYDLQGKKVIQVADKGLNCARNIYSAVKEADDGYIFSKSVHGKNLSKAEKEWVRKDDRYNVWTEVRNKKGTLVFKYKEAVDDYEYSFKDDDGKKQTFTVREKRVVTYNPALARKQQAQIQKQVDKARRISSVRESNRADYGDSVKYVTFSDEEGNRAKVTATINEQAIKEDMDFAGYNLLVTSETDKTATEIYDCYHQLWKIEESFRVMKTYLEARPVFLQTKESIYGHFLIVYLDLLVLRLLELKEFDNQLCVGEIVEYIRNFNVTKNFDGTYINCASKSYIIETIKRKLGLSKLSSLYLSHKNIDNILNAEFPQA